MYNEHYEIALKEWFEKTEFIQEWINENKISSKYLGMHRADIMKDLLEKYLESSLETLSKGKVMTNNKEWEVPYEIDALFNALSNLEHDNYERSYSGSKNREADAGLIRAALAAPAARPEHDPKALIDAARQAGWTFLRGADGRYTLQQLPPTHAQSVARQAGENAQPVMTLERINGMNIYSPTPEANLLPPDGEWSLYTTPQPAAQAAPLNLTDAEIERGWHATFSTGNPYCPCNLKSFTKAVRWAVSALTTQGTSDE